MEQAQVRTTRFFDPQINRAIRFVFTVTILSLLTAGTSQAVPIEYNLQPTAVVDVSVTKTPNTALSSASIGLEGTSTITIDDVTEDILGLSFTLTPGEVLILSSSYAGYDQITLESVEVSTNPASVITRQDLGSIYTFVATNVEVSATYSATDSGGVTAPSGSQPISFTTNFNGVYNTNLDTVDLFGVQLGALPGTAFSPPELETLIVLGNFSVEGFSQTPIPEPSTGLLLAGGLVWLVRSRRRAAI